MERAMEEKVKEVAAGKEMLKRKEAANAAKAEDMKDAESKAKVDDEVKTAQTHQAVKDIISNQHQTSDINVILQNRDVDKKEIKAALEIKLDKFDKIDDKFAEYAKKVKDEQPKIEKDTNLAKNEIIDEKL